MMESTTRCTQVVSEARGDLRDAPPLRQHLEHCEECRKTVTDVRRIAFLAREALEELPVPSGTAQYAMNQGRRLPTPYAALAAAAAGALVAAAISMSFPSQPVELATRSPQAGSSLRSQTTSAQAVSAPMVIELQPSREERVPFVIRGAGGVGRGELDLSDRYVLDTVPDEPIVLNTF